MDKFDNKLQRRKDKQLKKRRRKAERKKKLLKNDIYSLEHDKEEPTIELSEPIKPTEEPVLVESEVDKVTSERSYCVIS